MTEDKHGKEEEPLRETLKVTEGGEENDEDNDDIELEEDVYAVIYVEGFGIPFLYALGTAIMQLVIVALFFVDIKGNSPENRLNLPLAVDLNVRLTQFLALPLCVMAHEGTYVSMTAMAACCEFFSGLFLSALFAMFANTSFASRACYFFLRFVEPTKTVPRHYIYLGPNGN